MRGLFYMKLIDSRNANNAIECNLSNCCDLRGISIRALERTRRAKWNKHSTVF